MHIIRYVVHHFPDFFARTLPVLIVCGALEPLQDLMKAQGAKLWSLLSSGAHLYVCGDGASMAKDVHAALGEIAVAHGGLAGQEEATAFLQKMTEERRYVRDIWS